MPLVFGSLTDFGLDALTGHAPRLTFRAASPGVAGLNILSTIAVEAVPALNGYFEVDLATTQAIAPATYYMVQIHWTEIDPTRKDKVETLPWRLFVPPEGGALGDLLRVPANPALVFTGTEAPYNPSLGTWWLDPETGDLAEYNESGWDHKANLIGPPGYNATDAAQDLATLADYTNETAGANAFATAMNAKYARTKNLPRNAVAAGIDNTGAVDETVKINAFLQDCLNNQREAYFPRGTYLASQIVVPSKVTVRGAGIGGFGASGTEAGTMFRQTVNANKPFMVFTGNLDNGTLQIGPVTIRDITFRGEPGNATGHAIAFQGADGTPGTIQDTVIVANCLFRYWPQSGIYSPAGARPFHVVDCNFLWNGAYGIDFVQSTANYVQAVHFQDISGDGNTLGLVRLKGLDKHASVTFTSVKSERRVNPITATAGQLDCLVFEDCDTAAVTINGLTHISSIPSGAVRETPGAAMVVRGATGKRPVVTWRGVTVRVRSDDVQSVPGPSTLRDEISAATVPILVPNGSYATVADQRELFASGSSKFYRGTPGQVAPTVAAPLEGLAGTAPARSWWGTNAPANEKLWSMVQSGSNLSIRTHDDAGATGVLAMEIVRAGQGTQIVETIFNKRVRTPEFESSSATGGVILRSPNGTRYRLTVSDAGALGINPA